METHNFPRPIEGGNGGDGSPLRLGDAEQLGDVFASNGRIQLVDWDGDGAVELVESGSAVFAYRFAGTIADGTPIIDGGERLGAMSRSHQRDENDEGLCGGIKAVGDFGGDGQLEVIFAPRGYSQQPTVMLSLAGGPPADRAEGRPLVFRGGPEVDWAGADLTALDWDGDGRVDLVAAVHENEHYWLPPGVERVAEDQRDRYRRDGTWKGVIGPWSLHLLRNAGAGGECAFEYGGRIDAAVPGGTLCPVDRADPGAGLLALDYYGALWHLPLLRQGPAPEWGECVELCTLHGEPFTRGANFTYIDTAALEGNRVDLFASDIACNVHWCRAYGPDGSGRPIYGDPRKVKQRNPHVNGGSFSVPTTGDWRATGTADLVVGSVEGYVFWYRTLSTDPLRFAPPERVRVGDEEIRYSAKAHPATGHHWGGSQGPLDGNNGGYSNPVLVDFSGDGLLDLIVGSMIGLYDWYPNRGTPQAPKLDKPQRLRVGDESLFGPWRVQAGVGDFSGDGLPDVVTMDLDLDLALYRRVGCDDLAGLHPGEKLRFEDGETIKTHGPYTPRGGDGRGRTKIQVVDWDGNGLLDLLLGVGPQGGSPFRGSFVLLCRNAGSNEAPVFKRPEVLLYNAAGAPQEFFRHAAHPAPVDWDGDGRWELVVGADFGHIWYWRPEHFGAPSAPFEIYRPPGDDSL